MSRKPRLALTRIGKEIRSKLEPRIRIEEPSDSHHASARRDGDRFGDMVIQGDKRILQVIGHVLFPHYAPKFVPEIFKQLPRSR